MQVNQEININDYKDSYVVFLDILGYRSFIKLLDDKNLHQFDGINRSNLFNGLANLNKILRDESFYINNDKTTDLQNMNMTSISDSIIISVPKTQSNLINLMLEIINIQYSLLLSQSIMIRGYLTSGDVFHQDGYILGSGYIEAYEGEQRTKEKNTSGIVILSKNVLNDIKTYDKSSEQSIFNDFIKENWTNNDNVNYFINFLNPDLITLMHYQNNYSSFIEAQNFLEEIIFRQTLNYSNDPKDFRIFQKWSWMKEYFENVLSEHILSK